MSKFLDVKKTIETIVYISQKTNDLFHIGKILFFADKFHLENYGRLITGDHYRAMPNGPVPSGAYDIIKYVRGDGKVQINGNPEKAFKVEGKTKIIPIREPHLEYLSESDIECLDKAINLYAYMSLKKLRDIVHKEQSYKNTKLNGNISLNSIIQSLSNSDEVFEYLSS